MHGNTTASKSSEGDRGTKLTIHCKDEHVSFTSTLSAQDTDCEFHKIHSEEQSTSRNGCVTLGSCQLPGTECVNGD